MGRQPVQRYKDVQFYIQEIEEVYDVQLEFEFLPLIRTSVPMQRMTIRAWDKDGVGAEDGPVAYHVAEVPSHATLKQQTAIVRALTDVTYQCLERLAQRI